MIEKDLKPSEADEIINRVYPKGPPGAAVDHRLKDLHSYAKLLEEKLLRPTAPPAVVPDSVRRDAERYVSLAEMKVTRFGEKELEAWKEMTNIGLRLGRYILSHPAPAVVPEGQFTAQEMYEAWESSGFELSDSEVIRRFRDYAITLESAVAETLGIAAEEIGKRVKAESALNSVKAKIKMLQDEKATLTSEYGRDAE